MCFSASASFTASALLIPLGFYCLRTVLNKNTAYLPLAAVPVAFGIQQGAEGVVWWGINTDQATAVRIGSLAFMFFSHWFWLFWIPWLVLQLECNSLSRRICFSCTVIGGLYGALLYLPLLINNHWLSATVVHHSIEYHATFIGDAVPIAISRLIYISLILLPLFIATNRRIKVFGGLVSIAAVITYLLSSYAFVSVWCYSAAMLSFYIVYIVASSENLGLEPSYQENI